MRRLLLLALTLMSAAHAADIGLSPPRLELVLPPGGSTTQVVQLFNNGAAAESLGVSLGDWVQSGDGGLAFLPAGGAPASASPWVDLSAGAVAVPGGETTEYRLDVRIPDDPALAGTYTSVVFFETTPPAADAATAAIVTRQRLGLILYVTVAGTETGGAELLDLYRDGGDLRFVIANDGNTVLRLGGRIVLRDEAGADVAQIEVPSVPVQRESEREVALALPEGLEPGFYVALALVETSRGELAAGEISFEVP